MVVAEITCFVAVLLVFVLWKLTDKGVKGVPGPPGWPLLGNLLDMWVPVEEIFSSMLKLVDDYRKEPMVKVKFLHLVYYALLKGSAAEVILKDPRQVNKADIYDLTKKYLRSGLMMSRREKWEKRRKMINHSFHVSILEGFVPIFNEKSQVLVSKLEKFAGTGPFNVDPIAQLCALDTVCETTMGYALNSQDSDNCEYVEALRGLLFAYQTRMFRPWLRSDFLYSFTKECAIENRSLETIFSLTKEVIKNRRVLLEQDKQSQEKSMDSDDGFVRKRRLALLDLLIEGKVDGQSLTDEDILEEVTITMHAGHETTASSITSVLFLLGLHQDVQKRVREEFDNVFGDEDRPITSPDLVQLKYLEAVIKESLRLYPSGAFVGRQLSVDAVIGDHTIPAGANVYFPIYVIHRDPDVFPDPEKFCPERFYGETALKLTPYEYLPFSAGPRNCVAHKFAMMELKIVLTHVLRKFTLVSHQKPEDMKFLVGPVLEPVDGTIISLQKISTTNN